MPWVSFTGPSAFTSARISNTGMNASPNCAIRQSQSRPHGEELAYTSESPFQLQRRAHELAAAGLVVELQLQVRRERGERDPEPVLVHEIESIRGSCWQRRCTVHDVPARQQRQETAQLQYNWTRRTTRSCMSLTRVSKS